MGRCPSSPTCSECKILESKMWIGLYRCHKSDTMVHHQELKPLDLLEKSQVSMLTRESISHQDQLKIHSRNQKSQDSSSRYNFTSTMLLPRQMSRLTCSSISWPVTMCWDFKFQWRWTMEESKPSHAIVHNISIISNRSKAEQDTAQTWHSKNALLSHHSWPSSSPSLTFHLVEQKEVLDLIHRNIHRENSKRSQENTP